MYYSIFECCISQNITEEHSIEEYGTVDYRIDRRDIEEYTIVFYVIALCIVVCGVYKEYSI